jgi:predicted metal-binding membrane protein
MSLAAPEERTLLEAALRHHRWIGVVLLLVVPVAAWAWIVVMARDMHGDMSGASAWMMADAWDLPRLALLWAMWLAMMTAMMLPSAAPLMLLYAGAARGRGELHAGRQLYAMGTGYLVAWAAYSLAATTLQRVLAERVLLTPMLEPATPLAAAFVLALAGIYQLTPQKQACLRVCRSPLATLLQRWRPGAAGAFRMGLGHGSYCVGCCWALMLLLFAGGVMNLAVIVALSLWVLVEKLAPFGARTARWSGAALLAVAAWIALA